MKLDQWHAVLSTEPATPNQRGAIMAQFERLGFRSTYDRADRLTASAALLDLSELRSTRDLVMGEAGKLLCILQGFRDRAELDAAIAARTATGQPAARVLQMSMREAMFLAVEAWQRAFGSLRRQLGTEEIVSATTETPSGMTAKSISPAGSQNAGTAAEAPRPGNRDPAGVIIGS